MEFLSCERETLERLLPGLDGTLSEIGLADLERPGSPGIQAFRDAGGAGLLVPVEHGGLGATPLDAVRVQRAIGVRSPSLAVATTMHHFSVASLLEASKYSSGFEWMLLSAIAKERLLLASGFAEGKTGQGILAPTMNAARHGDKLLISGVKRPCSLSRSMDLLTASILVPDESGQEHFAVALIPAGSPGIEVNPFWGSWVLAGSESDEVVLTDVEVDPGMVVVTEVSPDSRLDPLQTAGFLWFELLITASYLGATSALVERVLRRTEIGAAERAAAVVAVQAVMVGVEYVARNATKDPEWQRLLSEALVLRYAAQDTIGRTTQRCVETLGGMSFVGSGEASYLAAAAAGLAFHPPSRSRMADQLCEVFAGGPLRV